MSVLVSVVTPCFNHGLYLDDAIQSIPYDKLNYEVEHIIVNDGSTDVYTIQKLSEINDPHIKIVHQENAGLSGARNTGIGVSKGEYIILLDADNKLHENYFTKGIEVLQQQNNVDVVYGDFGVFGNQSGTHISGEFDVVRMIEGNYIDACAVIRKSAFDRFGVYDTAMLHGFEDWELWLNFYLKGAVFYYLNDIGFYYRVTDGSMLKNITVPRAQQIRDYIYKKHAVALINFLTGKMKGFRKDSVRYNYAKQHPVRTIVKLILKKEI